jgi:hypothetical protein
MGRAVMTIGDAEPKSEVFEYKVRGVESNGLDRFSLPQWQIIWRALMPPGRADEGSTVLDAGCGEHVWSCSDYTVHGCDNWQGYFNRTEEPPPGTDNIDLCAEPWPYPDKSFDGVVSVDVLEHIENQWAFWRQAFRVARRFVIIATPNVHCSVSKALFPLTGRPWGFVAHEVEHSHHITPVFEWQMEYAAKKAGWALSKRAYANKPPIPQGGVLPPAVFAHISMDGPSQRAVVALFRPKGEGA